MSITAREAEEAKTSLLWIAARWPDLRARLRREGGNPLTGRVSNKGAEQPLVIDVGVSDLLAEIEAEAHSLAHVLMDEVTVTVEGWEDVGGVRVLVPREHPWQPTSSTMPALLVEVAGHYGHWTAGDDRTALAFCDWAEEYRENVRATLERPAPPSYMGDCPQMYPTDVVRAGEQYLTGDPCRGALYLRAGRATMRCSDCGQETSVDEQRDHVAATMAGMVCTQSEVRRALVVLGFEVPLDTVRSWTRVLRGRPARLVEAIEGEGLYQLTDAVTLAEEWASRRAG